MYKYKREDEHYLDEIMKKGPPYVKDIIDKFQKLWIKENGAK